MSSPTQADAGVLEATANKFDSVNTGLMNMLNRLLRELEAVQTAWQGHGGLAFQNVKSQWAEEQKNIQSALSETAQAIRDSGTTYTATDTNAATRMNSTNAGGGLPTLPL